MSLGVRFALQFGLTAALGFALAVAIASGLFGMRVDGMARTLGAGLSQAIETQLRREGEAALSQVAERAREALLAYDRGALDRIAAEALGRSGVLAVRVYDAQGRALADGGGKAQVFEAAAPEAMREIARAGGVLRWSEGERLMAARPVCIGQSCIGSVAVTIDGAPIARERAAVDRDLGLATRAFFGEAALLAVIALMLAAGLGALAGWLTGRRLTRSLRSAVDGLERLATGATTVSIEARDAEMRELAAAVDKVAEKLAELGRPEGDAILAEMADGLFVAARDGRVVVANPALHALLAAPEGALAGADAFAMFGLTPTGDLAAFAAAASAASRMTAPGGAPIAVMVSAKAAGGPDGRVIGVVRAAGSVADPQIERRLIEAQARAEAAERAKSEFLSVMSHELRTPLNGVLGGAAVLAGSELNPTQRSLVGIVQSSGKALLSMVTNILDMAKADAEAAPPEREPVDTEAVAREIARRVEAAAAAKGLALHVRVQPGAPIVLSDAERLLQIGEALADNAVKYTASGHVGLDLSHRVRAGVAELALTVDDSGIGIAPEKQETIFGAFAQGDSSAVREAGGAGVGLALTKKLVESLGGSISVESRPGKGSIFRVTLSADLDPTAEPAPPPAELLGERVLVAAPDPRERAALAEQFIAAGSSVETASTAAEAVALLRDALAEGAPFGVVVHPEDLADFEASGLAAWLRGERPPRPTASVALRAPQDPSALAELPERLQFAPEPGDNASLLQAAARAAAARAVAGGVGDWDAAPAPPSDEIAARRARPVETAPPPPQRVLLAEANEVNRIVLGAYLTKAGYQVEAAENGLEAVQAFKARRPTLVLMDVDMAVMNGLEAAKAIRKHEGEAEAVAVPIIALVGGKREGERERCTGAGMNDVLPKPIRMDDLEAKLERWTTLHAAGEAPKSLAS